MNILKCIDTKLKYGASDERENTYKFCYFDEIV